VALVFLPSCATSREPAPESAPEEEAVITVLARLVKEYSSFGPVFVCFDQGRTDPSAAVLKRLNALTGTACKPCSSRTNESGTGRPMDRISGAYGVVVGVSSIRKIPGIALIVIGVVFIATARDNVLFSELAQPSW
jgi:hypothetical protein